MKYFLVFLVVCVALAAASPQFFWPGYAGVAPASSTVVAGPTVVNEAAPRYFAPGWPAFY